MKPARLSVVSKTHQDRQGVHYFTDGGMDKTSNTFCIHLPIQPEHSNRNKLLIILAHMNKFHHHKRKHNTCMFAFRKDLHNDQP